MPCRLYLHSQPSQLSHFSQLSHYSLLITVKSPNNPHCFVTFALLNRHSYREQMENISFRNDVLPLKNVLYRLALRITLSREDAEDIVQDTLIKVWNRRDDWHDIGSIEAYSLTVCRNLSLDRMKRADAANQTIGDDEAGKADSGRDPYERMMQRDRVEQVRRIVDSLPEKQKSCMQLRDFEGKSYKEIAKALAMSEEQVKVNIFRARQAVKQKYNEIEGYGL